MKKWDVDEFRRRATLVHGDRYDYSNVVYVGATTNVAIVCPEHGTFHQKPNNHVNLKQGCSKCTGKHQHTTEEFIVLARSVHGDKYDYSQSVYVNARTELVIGCAIHGQFSMRPNSHLSSKQGCPKCANKHKTLDVVLDEARLVHGDKYDYSSILEYVNTHTPVQIVCQTHGPFMQSFACHISSKQGCPVCGYDEHRGRYQHHTSDQLNAINAQFYVVRLSNETTSLIKVGVTKNTWAKRLGSRQHAGFAVDKLWVVNGPMDLCLSIETKCIEVLAPNRYHGVKFHGHTECFIDSDSTVTIILNILQEHKYE